MGFLDIRYFRVRNVIVAFQLVQIGAVNAEQGDDIEMDVRSAIGATQARIRA